MGIHMCSDVLKSSPSPAEEEVKKKNGSFPSFSHITFDSSQQSTSTITPCVHSSIFPSTSWTTSSSISSNEGNKVECVACSCKVILTSVGVTELKGLKVIVKRLFSVCFFGRLQDIILYLFINNGHLQSRNLSCLTMVALQVSHFYVKTREEMFFVPFVTDGMQSRFLFLLEELCDEVKVMRSEVKKALKVMEYIRNNTSGTMDQVKLPEGYEFPLASVKEAERLDADLKADAEKRRHLVCYHYFLHFRFL